MVSGDRLDNTIVDSVFWEHNAVRPTLPELTDTIRADLCVVGLGGSGLATALEASARGMSVVGVDAGRIAGAAAGRNGGLLLAGTVDPYHELVARVGRKQAARMYQATLDEMQRTIDLIGEQARMTGVIRAEYTDEGLADCQAQYDALRADGFAVEHYDGDQGRGIVMPSDGSFDPVARAITFANAAVAQGCRYFENSPALEIRSGEVVTPRGSIKATHIVVATDGSVMRLLPEAAREVRPVRLQMVATAPSVAHIERPVYARWGYDYWQQRPDGSVLIGGGRDVLRDDEETDQQVSTAQARNYLMSLLSDLAVYEPITHAWAGIVGYSASGQPWVSQPHEGVYGIGGYCGTGNVVGTLLGRSLIELFVEGDSQTLQDFGYLD